ncbi:MAG TPA: hypothetical protein VFJ68_13520 [Casimicrobiaceae bacterium]|nr:hypothetical protein [Casimicrobiaceae bacterium]
MCFESARSTVRGVLAVVALAAMPAYAASLSPEELARICANAEDTSHCARLVEEVQLKRLPNLAVRDGATLRVSLYPAGIATLADTEALNGGRSYSLWDYISELNAVVLYTTDGDEAFFTVLQRATARKTELPAEPRVSPDRAYIVTADFCEKRCVNELAVWRVTRDGIRKAWTWKPREAWSDAVASWKNADTVTVDYSVAGREARSVIERRLDDPSWVRAPTP